jgi:calcineurin-like phosphoesterase family protein
MPMIWLTSDLHLGHDKDFIWKARGFESIEEHDAFIMYHWNKRANEDDDIYVLGDMVMGDHSNIEKIRQLKGRIHLIRGNHDTDARMKKYAELDNIVEICEGKFMRYKKYFLFLSHFPSITDNVEKETLREATLNLFGHTHQESHFYGDNPYMYNVGIDAHNGYIILLDDILTEMKENYKLHFEN